ncbi:MAG: hypothetical protein AAF673_04425 [Pseudomonadota bacterium]
MSKKLDLNRIEKIFKLVEKETYVRSKGLIDLGMCKRFAFDVLNMKPTQEELNVTRSADGFSLLHVAINKLNPFMVAVLIYLGANTKIIAKKSGITPEKLMTKIGNLGSNMQEAFYNAEDFLKQYEIIDTTSDVDNSDYVDDYDFDSDLAKALKILKSEAKDIMLRPNSLVSEIDDDCVDPIGDNTDN